MSSLAKPDARQAVEAGFWKGLFQTGLYKPTQGRIVRQVTAASVGVLLLFVAFESATAPWLVELFQDRLPGAHYVVFVFLAAVAAWFTYRLVNYSRLADFLISVEAEMNKVSWPGRTELWRATLVVIFVIVALAVLLFAFDLFWTRLFQFLRIRT